MNTTDHKLKECSRCGDRDRVSFSMAPVSAYKVGEGIKVTGETCVETIKHVVQKNGLCLECSRDLRKRRYDKKYMEMLQSGIDQNKGVINLGNIMDIPDDVFADTLDHHILNPGQKDEGYSELNYWDQEIVICSAVIGEDGTIVRGHRHNDCILSLVERDIKPASGSESQGFMTSRNRYVTREEGRKIQESAGIKSVDPQGYRGTTLLFSEDLY